jgi:hypothetical protein
VERKSYASSNLGFNPAFGRAIKTYQKAKALGLKIGAEHFAAIRVPYK